ncbi:SusC/RagA family TonB-linked outer membrane protein [Candidatus Bacteroides intestinigallinarum]|uniref:SusC/RagA family TonB-linked outer membrane protein n=1 Tax=Candidatus Bacteroides intestinigallinarum TaxID=2838470 RepID=UPI002165F7BE|nr:TonB-dependent receptor [Candidatus Bacteroides intestinigallinarum]MCS3201928.1 TonB-dependent receptor [Candidatus Bacteroides intestinigallinarum]
MKKVFMCMIPLLIFAMGGFAQTIDLSGTVKDDKGEPIPGASILVKGTQNGALSNVNGEFSIVVKKGQTLVCSFIGYVTEQAIVNQSRINFVLREDVAQLNEVVVVGYGGVKKGDLTGSVSAIKMDKLEDLPANNSVFSSLQGRVAGLQIVNSGQGPGSNPAFIVRGISSINGTQSPLVVVDGFPLGEGADLKQINPADIADIVVLKDASSTSIYGSRGANGVIMVTTRKAGKGTTHINFSHQTIISQFSSKLNLWRDPVLMAQLDNESRVNAGQLPLYVGRTDNGTYYPSVEEISSGAWPYFTRWDDEILRTPVTNNTSLSISGANDKLIYNLSVNYFDDRGTYIKDNYRKLSAKLDVDYKAFKNFSIRTSNILSKNWRNANSGDIGRNPLFPVYDEEGNYYQSSPTDYGNPIALANTVKNKNQGMDVLSSWLATWEIIDGLTWKGQLNYKYGTTVNDLYNPKKYTEDGTFNNGHAYIGNWYGQDVIPETYLTYDRMLGMHGHLTAMAGYSYKYSMERSSALDSYDFVNESLGNENIGAGNPQKNQVSNGFSESELVSYYGKINFSWMDKYLLTATFRSDGSSKFGDNNKWASFPSGALAWKLHNEKFMSNLKFINEAKLRASYGISGNQGIAPYQTLSRYGNEKYYDNGAWNTAIGPGYVIGSYGSDGRYKYWGGIPNKDLKWETTRQLNFGFDVTLLDNRIRLVFDWYKKHTFDLLRQRYLPLSSGYDKMWVNDGEVQNRGFEFTIDADVVRTKDFSFNSTFIFSRNRSKVLSLGSVASSGLNVDPNTGMQYEFTGATLTEQPVGSVNILAVGQPLNVFYGYKTNGIIQSNAEGIEAGMSGDEAKAGELKYMDINNDRAVDEKDRTIIGNPNPDFTASLNLSFKYKKFDLSIFLNGVFGNDVLYQYGMTNPATMPLRWTVDNPNNEYPSLRQNRTPKVSDWFVRDGSFVRIQDINFGYTFDHLCKGVSSLRLYGSINNLYTFTSFDGYDPEVGLDGIYWGGYPRFRKFTLGMNITF